MDIVADIALVFHWTHDACMELTDDQFLGYHERAIERLKLLHKVK